MNKPTTSTEQMLAVASKGVSSTLVGADSGFVSDGSLGACVFFFVIQSLVARLPKFAAIFHKGLKPALIFEAVTARISSRLDTRLCGILRIRRGQGSKPCPFKTNRRNQF
jgi:hypothetical protein